jgi:hypothetical protein
MGVYPLPVESRQQADAEDEWPKDRGDDSAIGGWLEGWLELDEDALDVRDEEAEVSKASSFKAEGDADLGPVARVILRLHVDASNLPGVDDATAPGLDLRTLDLNVVAPVPHDHVEYVFAAIKEQSVVGEIQNEDRLTTLPMLPPVVESIQYSERIAPRVCAVVWLEAVDLLLPPIIDAPERPVPVVDLALLPDLPIIVAVNRDRERGVVDIRVATARDRESVNEVVKGLPGLVRYLGDQCPPIAGQDRDARDLHDIFGAVRFFLDGEQFSIVFDEALNGRCQGAHVAVGSINGVTGPVEWMPHPIGWVRHD